MRALVLAVALASAPAWAVYQCGDQRDDCQCGANNPYPCCDNGGNCTWWAWEAACCNWGVGLPGWGNANQWAGHANTNASYDVLSYPVSGAVSCRTLGTYGHVAFVTGLSGANISVTEENCWGNYGMRAASYASGFFQAYIVRVGQTECRPGDSQTRSCGNCGTQARGCGASGKWAGWSTCGAEGECAPDATQEQACGQCGSRDRTCGGSCRWGAYPSSCSGPDPDGGTVACDTGRAGACGAAVLRCVDGGLACPAVTAPTAEICNGLDDDCDGQIDEGLSCGASDAGGPAGGADAGDETPLGALSGQAVGSCASTGGGPVVLAFLLAALIFWRRPRVCAVPVLRERTQTRTRTRT